MDRERVTFKSHGETCAGYLYRPAGGGPAPCVVLGSGFSGTMDWILPDFARAFAANGIAALIFDYRTFGESGGFPRQWISVRRQRQDIHAVLKFARGLKGIDPKRVALWGTSMGGGHMIDVASRDARVAAVVAQVPGIDMVRKEARATIRIPPGTIARLLAAAVWDGLRGAFGFAPYYVKVFGKPGELAIFTDPALMPRFEALVKGSPTWRNAFTPRFYLAPPRYRDGTVERIKVPLLICVADRDVYAQPAFQAGIASRAPRGEVKHYDAEHFGLYHEKFEEASRDQIAFLKRHLQDTR
jgi:pimeloyl-ACP methyl ester carboxylesterase